jgi:hypothetical protein
MHDPCFVRVRDVFGLDDRPLSGELEDEAG